MISLTILYSRTAKSIKGHYKESGETSKLMCDLCVHLYSRCAYILSKYQKYLVLATSTLSSVFVRLSMAILHRLFLPPQGECEGSVTP